MVEWLPDRIGDYDPYNFFTPEAGPILLRWQSYIQHSLRAKSAIRLAYIAYCFLRSATVGGGAPLLQLCHEA